MGDIADTDPLIDVLEREQSRFMRFLVARTRDPDLAEDLLQEARAKLLGNSGASSAGAQVSNPIPYIFQTLANLVEDHRRSESARAQRGRDWGDRGEGLEPGRADQITPEQQAVDRDMLDKTMEALNSLPEKTRAIFIAYRIEGTSQRQIAEDAGLSLSAVEKHLQRAYRAVVDIRQKLGAGFE